ncbi:hypothetical protein EV361DRAFT_52481 [Lentinula raphanica]|nr:hypothetical protein EV361DRAFT_52481 [Lentinula raphanica]
MINVSTSLNRHQKLATISPNIHRLFVSLDILSCGVKVEAGFTRARKSEYRPYLHGSEDAIEREKSCRYKGLEFDFCFLPNLTMPKVTSTSKSASPSTSASALKQQHTKKIVARLIAIRTSRSMTMNPPEPMINPANESIVGKSIFNGSTREVNSPLHPDFRKLGTIFWVVRRYFLPV